MCVWLLLRMSAKWASFNWAGGQADEDSAGSVQGRAAASLRLFASMGCQGVINSLLGCLAKLVSG